MGPRPVVSPGGRGADGGDIKLWVDGDAAPRDVKEIVFRSALRLEIEAVLVASQRLPLPANNRFASVVRVDVGPDEADNYIAEHAEPGDIAVTADIPLASRLVGKGVLTLDPRGTEYSRENIGERLSVRDFMEQVRLTGVDTGGPGAYGQRDKQSFANALDRTLTRLGRSG